MKTLLALFLAGAVACGSSTAPGSGGADVVIVGVSGVAGVVVSNIGGAGAFYIESWDQATYGAPGGDNPTLIHMGDSPVTQAPAGYSGTVFVGYGKRYVAKTRVPNGTAYFTSSCYGSC